MTRDWVDLRIAATASLSGSAVRATMATSAPEAANRAATARPIPLLPPVTIAARRERLISIASSQEVPDKVIQHFTGFLTVCADFVLRLAKCHACIRRLHDKNSRCIDPGFHHHCRARYWERSWHFHRGERERAPTKMALPYLIDRVELANVRVKQ